MKAVGYIISLHGRSPRPSMWLITILFLGLGLVRELVASQGFVAWPLGAAQIALIWPALIAVPVRRFHDMGRSIWWVVTFLFGAIAGFLFLMLDLTTTAGLLNLSPFTALSDPDTYLAELTAYNDTRDGEPLKPLSAIGQGGLSLAAIFLFIQFGWLHIIPGQRAENKYGPRPNASIQ